MLLGEMLLGKTSLGKMSLGETLLGKTSLGKTLLGKMSLGKMLLGELSLGEPKLYPLDLLDMSLEVQRQSLEVSQVMASVVYLVWACRTYTYSDLGFRAHAFLSQYKSRKQLFKGSKPSFPSR
jgi:hypothetical protein